MKKFTSSIIWVFVIICVLITFNSCKPDCPTCPPPCNGCAVSLMSDQLLFTNNGNTVQRFYIVNYISGADPRNIGWLMANKLDDFPLRPGESVTKIYPASAGHGVGVCTPSNTVALGIFDYASVRNILHVNNGICCKYNGVTVSTTP